MKAFENFKKIQELNNQDEKLRTWLKDYENLHFSIGKKGKDLIFWKKEKEKYVYSDKLWPCWWALDFKGNYLYVNNINKIQRRKKRLVIEFDDKDKDDNKDKEKIKGNLIKVKEKLKELKTGFIESTHGGNSNYIWVEFTRELKEKEAKAFLQWIAPENSEVDLNFCSDNKRFPILFAPHWKYDVREEPIDFFEGEQIDFESLKIPLNAAGRIVKTIQDNGYSYPTFKKAARVFSQEGQAEHFNKIQPLFYDKTGCFWLWDSKKKKWNISDDIDILNMIQDATNEDTISSKNRTEILNSLKQEGRRRIPDDIKETWIQFKDKIIDIKTNESYEASPNYFVTNPIPWEIGNSEETPTMDKLFEEWVGVEHKKILYEIAAYCLLPDYPIHRLFCFVGGGLNGKSCYLRLIKKFVGDENLTSTELDTLMSSRFEITKLHKKLVCQMGETDFNELKRTSILKKLTGQDAIGFEYKNKTPFDDSNYAKIMISTNNLPTTDDKTIGFYRRWCIIDFPNMFSEKKDVLSEIPEEEYNNLAKKSIKILKELLENRQFTSEGSIEERQKKYEDRSNPIEKFFKETIEEDFESFITKSSFKKTLDNWLKINKFREHSDRSINKFMKDKGIKEDRDYIDWWEDDKKTKKLARVWRGIKLK